MTQMDVIVNCDSIIVGNGQKCPCLPLMLLQIASQHTGNSVGHDRRQRWPQWQWKWMETPIPHSSMATSNCCPSQWWTSNVQSETAMEIRGNVHSPHTQESEVKTSSAGSPIRWATQRLMQKYPFSSPPPPTHTLLSGDRECFGSWSFSGDHTSLP